MNLIISLSSCDLLNGTDICFSPQIIQHYCSHFTSSTINLFSCHDVLQTLSSQMTKENCLLLSYSCTSSLTFFSLSRQSLLITYHSSQKQISATAKFLICLFTFQTRCHTVGHFQHNISVHFFLLTFSKSDLYKTYSSPSKMYFFSIAYSALNLGHTSSIRCQDFPKIFLIML